MDDETGMNEISLRLIIDITYIIVFMKNFIYVNIVFNIFLTKIKTSFFCKFLKIFFRMCK